MSISTDKNTLVSLKNVFASQEREVKLSVENATQSSWEKIMELEKVKMEVEEQLFETKKSVY